ncbi:MAG TPA: SDR family oxidoreductase [Solirubrobacteraceae bacterium]|nr:SDR family oxidoreductase [Solirubrobacteraceae bacterium]
MPSSLITGFPGFIGRRLVRKLLEADRRARVVALVEPRMLEAARAAAEEIDASRIDLVAGDISDRRLGLDDAEYARLAADVRRVYHLAAIYDLAVPIELAERVNVDGTGNVLELCLAAKKLERLVYVSTAYVAGRRKGIVYEHELTMGQGFKNHYESTKFQAEVWVRQLLDRIPTTILRPAIVVGDSQTGETQKFDGPYYLLRAIAQAERQGRPPVQIGASDATFNVVPVDFVVDSIAAVADDPATVGETLHLVDPHPVTTRELVEMLSREYAGRAPRGKLPPALAQASLRFKPIRRLFSDTPAESIAYLNHRVTFDTRRAVDLLTPHGLAPPPFASYVGPMVEFFKANQDDPALAPRAAG